MAFVPRGHSDPTRLYLWGLATLPLWVALFKSYGLYDRDIRRINHSTIDDIPWIFHTLIVGCVLMWGYYKLLLPSNGVAFQQLVAFGVISGGGMLSLRFLARKSARRLLGSERVLLIGHTSELDLLARKLNSHPEYGAVTVGRLGLRDAVATSSTPLLGQLDTADLGGMLIEHRAERVVVAHRDVEHQRLLDLIHTCQKLGVKISIVPRLFDVLGSTVEVDDVEGVTVLEMNPPVLSRSSRGLKRAMDIIGALALVVLTAPIQLLVALAIKLDDGGPILFRQRRVGRWDRRFDVFKFRTMCVDAEAKREELLALSRDPRWLLLEQDPRITRVGRFLRFSSLDELPQLWNILLGDMSLVGPRPLIEIEASQVTGWGRCRVDLKPGLTGLWQVLGRTTIPFEEMVKLDYLYVTNWSLWNDMRLLLRTFPIVLARRGAN